jgi:hypothetical protein
MIADGSTEYRCAALCSPSRFDRWHGGDATGRWREPI